MTVPPKFSPFRPDFQETLMGLGHSPFRFPAPEFQAAVQASVTRWHQRTSIFKILYKDVFFRNQKIYITPFLKIQPMNLRTE